MIPSTLRRLTLLLVSCFLVTGCGDEVESQGDASQSGSGGGQSSACSVDGLDAGNHEIAIEHDGRQRDYRLHLPANYDAQEPLPLVINFHGLGSNAIEQAAFSAMDPHADENGYAVVYPNGVENSWNGGDVCCGTASSEQIDDVAFTRALVADVATQACIDERRVYATGMSNGGFMSHRLACEASDLITAAAPVAGLLGIPQETCQPERPIPIIHFYGTADSLVPYDFADDVDAVWADRNGCTGEPTVTYQNGSVTCSSHEDCEAGVTVTLCSAEGMGHCWPGQSFCPFGDITQDISANAAMWELFSEHALP